MDLPPDFDESLSELLKMGYADLGRAGECEELGVKLSGKALQFSSKFLDAFSRKESVFHKNAPSLIAYTTNALVDGAEQVRFILHGPAPGMWQCYSRLDMDFSSVAKTYLVQLAVEHPGITEVLDIPLGHMAERSPGEQTEWSVRELPHAWLAEGIPPEEYEDFSGFIRAGKIVESGLTERGRKLYRFTDDYIVAAQFMQGLMV